MAVSPSAPIRVGVIGLGGAANGMIPRFDRNPRFTVAGAADLDAEILGRFHERFPNAETHPNAEGLCASKNIDFIYIATPNRFHQPHTVMALNGGKHVLVEKPMTVSLAEADAMVEAADRNGVLLGVNVKHSFEPRIQKLREFTKSGEFGELRMINDWRYQNWLYRPRTPEELTPEWGGGILWRQGGHQLDLMRTIGRGKVYSVRGSAQVWDKTRRVPGAHTAYFEFESGASATCVYSGHDHFRTSELVFGFEAGKLADPAAYGQARRELASHNYSVEWEAGAARAERFGGERQHVQRPDETTDEPRGGWIMGGPLLVSYDHADVKLSPKGLMIYGDEKQWEISLSTPGQDGRDFRLNAFADAIATGRPLQCDGRWGKATAEVLLAIEQSGRERKEVYPQYQVAYAD